MNNANKNSLSKTNQSRTNFKMFKAGKRWVFACAAVLTMMGGTISAFVTTPYMTHAATESVLRRAASAPKVSEPVTTDDTTVSGTADPNVTISIKVATGEDIEGQSDSNGDFSVEITKQPLGTVLEVMAIGADFLPSEVTYVTVKAASTTTVDAPDVNKVTTSSTTITGTAAPNSHITVTKDDGSKLVEGDASSSGSFSLTIPKQAAGTNLHVTATVNDVPSKATTVQVTDDSTPATVAAPVVGEATEGDTSLSGTATPGDTIQVFDS
ncbi:Ig-like domain-containing protein [Lacticaseibacillus sharpeae]|nr:Ig-like domain-containing protein [Lacticaseibacillus sharpeae]